jgi:hypothetical protein
MNDASYYLVELHKYLEIIANFRDIEDPALLIEIVSCTEKYLGLLTIFTDKDDVMFYHLRTNLLKNGVHLVLHCTLLGLKVIRVLK